VPSFTLQITPSTRFDGGTKVVAISPAGGGGGGLSESVPPPAGAGGGAAFLKESAAVAVASGRHPADEHSAGDAFAALDPDGRGVLGLEQVGRLGEIMGKTMTKTELMAAFDEMDLDGDGFVSFAEFEQWFGVNGSASLRLLAEMDHAVKADRIGSEIAAVRGRIDQLSSDDIDINSRLDATPRGGRLTGEEIGVVLLSQHYGATAVEWVNEGRESGNPHKKLVLGV
jgi:hypothetical protein